MFSLSSLPFDAAPPPLDAIAAAPRHIYSLPMMTIFHLLIAFGHASCAPLFDFHQLPSVVAAER